MPPIEAKYQENGFELLLYKERKADKDFHCPECKRALFHVATIFDQWAEHLFSVIHYHYCRHDQIIIQRTIRSDQTEQIRSAIFEQPPHELLVELLATARQQNGRNVTQLTINQRWWAPGRYPVALGEQIESKEAAEVDLSAGLDWSSEEALPIQRYESQDEQVFENPFTSRRAKRSDKHTPPQPPKAEEDTPTDE